MTTWQEFAAEAPALAAFGQERLTQRIAYLATVRPDGAPRVHPVSPFIGQGHLFVFMEPTSPKGHDLQRDSRYALHCAVEDNQGGGGEFYLSGRARLVEAVDLRQIAVQAATKVVYTPEERYILFELGLKEVLSTVYDEHGPVRRRWQAR